VTGASSGLGVAFAQALAEAGADLVLAARRVERLEATRAIVEQAGRRAITVAADVALPENALAVVEAAITAFGHVDVLVNNAGKGTAVPATREAPAQFREVIDINLNGCYWMAQACGRVMQRDHRHRERRRARQRRAPAGGLFGEQGWLDWADA
jgi:NAD(P)-dependent dehydrogenase (short-subunit alcohol dehydrogenase family)